MEFYGNETETGISSSGITIWSDTGFMSWLR